MKVLMCRPEFFDIEYEINPWMNVENKVDRKKALEQWQTLYDTYKRLSVEIELIKQVKGLPDMVFTANAGTVYSNTFISGNFRFKERKGEERYYRQWFSEQGYDVMTLHFFQGGEGDALFYRNVLYMGYGFRSHRHAHREIAKILGVEIVSLRLVDPYFYDFDTTFCPIGTKGFLYYPPAFSEESRNRLAKVEGAIEMTKAQAEGFIGNSVSIDGKLLVGYLDDDLREKLKKLSVEPILLDMSEFKKSGGGIKCCTLYLER